MAQPFVRRPAETGLRRLVGNRRSCLREIEDLLAEAGSVREVAAEQVAAIADRYGVDLATRLGTGRRDLYRRLLEHFLADQELSAEETADAEHLRRVLALSNADAAAVHDQVAHAVYGQAIDRVLADHQLDPEEQSFLASLGRTLELPDAERDQLLDEGARRARRRFLQRTRVPGGALVAGHERVLELSGASPRSLEDAIRGALDEAVRAVPDLRGFEVTKIHGAIEGGAVSRWEVALRATYGGAE